MRARFFAIAAGIVMLAAGPARASCPFQNTVSLKLLTAGFQAWKSVAAAMRECGNVTTELDQDFADKLPQALAAKPALYQMVGPANDSIVSVLDAGTIRPLDLLVAKYGQDLTPNQLIKLNGKIYVIGMDVNDQSLLYRSDILKQLDIPVPQTWDDVLAAAAKIRQAGVMQYPIGATMKAGWNLGLEFVDMFLAYGGDLFGANNQPAVDSAAGIKTLETMKKLTAYMDPNYLSADSTYVQQQMQEGKIALTNLWASRAGSMNNPQESRVVGKVASAPAPAAIPGGKPATTVWWDGIAIATNITEEQADAAFRVALAGLSPEMMEQHKADVIWLIKGYKPDPLSEGAIKSLQAGAPAYPVSVRMALIHTAIGNNIGDFFTGKLTAQQALAAAEQAYRTAAKENGLLQ